MADAIVDGTFSDLSAGNMDDRNTHDRSHRCDGQHFITVAEDHYKIGPDIGESLRYANGNAPHDQSTRRTGVVGYAFVNRDFDHAGEAVGTNLVDGMAVARVKVHVGGYDAHQCVGALT